MKIFDLSFVDFGSKSRGSALIITLLVISVLATVSLGFGRVFVSDALIGRSFEDTQQAFYDAQAGLEDGMRQFITNRNLEGNLSPPVPAIGKIDSLTVSYREFSPTFGAIEKDDSFEIDTAGLESQGATSLSFSPSWEATGPLIFLEVTRINAITGGLDQIICYSLQTCTGIALNNTAKVRVKPVGSRVKQLGVATNPNPFKIDTGKTVIVSSGAAGLAKRKLSVMIDRKSGTLLGIDYALLSQNSIQ